MEDKINFVFIFAYSISIVLYFYLLYKPKNFW